MKIAIVGARAFSNPEKVKAFVRGMPAHWEIVSGGCAGVDTWAQEACEEQHRNFTVFYADWKVVGKAAGRMRNSEIAQYCDAAVGFTEGPSKGTVDTIKKVASLRRPVWTVDATDDLPSYEEIVEKIARFSRSSSAG